MVEANVISYIIQNQFELNLSYMPFIIHGGIFVPTNQEYKLGEKIILNLGLPNHSDIIQIECRVVWITPKNSMHYIYQGVGLQFMGENATNVVELIKANLDSTMDVGGYTYGMGMSTESHNV